jgi:Domain of unknown function (DUF1707)
MRSDKGTWPPGKILSAGKQSRYAYPHRGAAEVPVTTGPQDPMASRHRLRAGHADREQVIEALKTAFVDGRLTKNELAARTGRALAARTYADLAALTADIPAEPAAAEPVTAAPAPARPTPAAGPPGPAIRRPLAKAAAISGVCLLVAAVAVLIGLHVDESGSGPSPDHAWAGVLILLGVGGVIAAPLIMGLGVVTSIQQRRSRRQLPPQTGTAGHGLDGGRHDDASHGSVPPGSRTDQTRTDLRARESRQRGRRIPARERRASGGVSPVPGTA